MLGSPGGASRDPGAQILYRPVYKAPGRQLGTALPGAMVQGTSHEQG